MNLALRLFGLRNEARRRTSWLFVLGLLAFAGASAFSAFNVWHLVDTAMFERLNGCTDSRSTGFGMLQEQPYQPSHEYVACLNGVHRTAAIEASLVIGVMLCAAVAFVAWGIEDFVNDYAVPANGSQARTYHFGVLYVCCLVLGVLFALLFRAILDPYAS